MLLQGGIQQFQRARRVAACRQCLRLRAVLIGRRAHLSRSHPLMA